MRLQTASCGFRVKASAMWTAKLYLHVKRACRCGHSVRVHIADAIRRHRGNRTAAAKELGINPSTLFRKIKSLGITLPDEDGRSREEN